MKTHLIVLQFVIISNILCSQPIISSFDSSQHVLDGLYQKLGRISENNAFKKKSDVLVVVATANVLFRTKSLLQSLSAIQDSFDLLFVDELSTDGTPKYLETRNVHFISPDSPNGVTHNWNLGYKYFVENEQYQIMYISNNDVLIPNGAIDKLSNTLRNCDCEFISPLSTKHGKGHLPHEGIENVFKVKKYHSVVNTDINYQLVQDALNQFQSDENLDECSVVSVQKEFNGFFFGFKRSISKIAHNETTLFDPKNRNIHQEIDLSVLLNQKSMKICLHNTAFIFHYKASTISGNINRQAYVRP
eukprot:TRINITY_DN2097_c0_g1_i2.p1 TRINITY_DN2097_c0_g1~~TRINITY_DN2097_c0_g1_i2.p1  ORF type:complete len:303 (-),score=12.58 TRINITY_DN2097_c0_g1_i2:426-1334(-)